MYVVFRRIFPHILQDIHLHHWLLQSTLWQLIAKMLGHTDIRTTRIYAKIMNSTIANEMKVLQNKFAI